MSCRPNVLMIGTDLSSNGGIASVVKAYYFAHQKGNYSYKLHLLKTNYYKDKSMIFEALIFLRSFMLSIFAVVVKNISIFHIHSSANVSFYRKTFFIVLGKLLRRKVILHLHSSDFYNFFLSDRKVVKYVLPMCDCVVVLCSDWQRKLSSKYPNLNIKKIEKPYEFSETIGQAPTKNSKTR